MVLPAAGRSLKTINEIFQSTSPRCAMTINPSRGGDGKFALAKGAQRGLYSRPIPHRPRIEITFFSVSFFLSQNILHTLRIKHPATPVVSHHGHVF